MTSAYSFLLGRFLLGLYFLLPGLMKVASPGTTVAYMEFHGIPYAGTLMWIAAASNIIGGLLLMSGRYVKLAAFGFVLYVLLVNLTLHDFWTMAEEVVPRERQNFFKNLAILAGLLVLASAAPLRGLSIKGWWRSDKAVLTQ